MRLRIYNQCGSHVVESLRCQFFELAQVGFVELALLGAIGIPVPIAMRLFPPYRQGSLGTTEGKRLRGLLLEPGIPGGRAEQDWRPEAIGAIEHLEMAIEHLGNAMTCHKYMPHAGNQNYLTGDYPLVCQITDKVPRSDSAYCYSLR